MKLDPTPITLYVATLENVCKLFEAGVQQKEFIEHTGIPRHTFSRKIKNRTFTPDELLKIIEYYNNKIL